MPNARNPTYFRGAPKFQTVTFRIVPDAIVKTYPYDPAAAEKAFSAPLAAYGQRFHLTIKVSTEEQVRLIGAALQDQWKKIGVDIEVRSLELATLFADLTKGNFQLSYLKWVGANNDPDVFALAISMRSILRGHSHFLRRHRVIPLQRLLNRL